MTAPSRVRYYVLGLAVAAYMVTYIDRVVIGAAAPVIQKELGFSLVTMGWALSAFRWGYALFQIPGGWLGDRIGPRRALALIVTCWSVFTSLTAMSWNASSLIVCRFLFGVSEAGAFPIATRSLARWMLPSERGFSQGITHAGSRLGAALTPALVVTIIASSGWRTPFVLFGGLGLLWVVVWLRTYRDTPAEHPWVNTAERELLAARAGGPRERRAVPWAAILKNQTLWYLSAMYFCYAYAIAVYLDWFPTYLKEHRGFTLKQMGFYASLPLLAGTAGDLAGGWLSDVLLARGVAIAGARRRVAVVGFVLAAAGIVPATLTPDPQMCVWLTCLGVFGLELTVGVSWAVALDISGDFAGSVSAVMNMCGNIGAAISPAALAYLVKGFGWDVPFLVTSGLCVVGAALYWKIDPARRIA